MITISKRGSLLRILAGSVLIGVAVYLERRGSRELVRADRLRNPFAGSRNVLDRFAVKLPNPRAAAAADAGLFAGPALPIFLAWHPRSRRHYPKILLVWLEAMVLNFGLNAVVKNAVNRPRPYILHPAYPGDNYLNRKDRSSFYSGHTSNAAAGAVLFSKFVELFVEDSGIRRASVVAAWVLPFATAILRVRAAKHWPTDIVVGLAVGHIVSRGVFWLATRPHEDGLK